MSEKKMNKQYSVLMSVYYREKPENLRHSMESIFMQSVPTNDFVLVCDGALTPELDEVIVDMIHVYGDVLSVVRLKRNCGLGHALNIGLGYCKNDLIARMDSDDISYVDRCEKQLRVFEQNQDIDICSGTVLEFSIDIGSTTVCRKLPELHEDICLFAKKRNPFNHPCVMYKKSAVEEAGSYQDFYLLEDYYLWVRMLQHGFKGYNIQAPILYMRAGDGMYKRRSGLLYVRSQIALFKYMLHSGFIGYTQFLSSCILRCSSSIVPNCIRKMAFRIFLRGE